MTKADKPTTRETAVIVRRRPVIVTVTAHFELRLKGTRPDRHTAQNCGPVRNSQIAARPPARK